MSNSQVRLTTAADILGGYWATKAQDVVELVEPTTFRQREAALASSSDEEHPVTQIHRKVGPR